MLAVATVSLLPKAPDTDATDIDIVFQLKIALRGLPCIHLVFYLDIPPTRPQQESQKAVRPDELA